MDSGSVAVGCDSDVGILSVKPVVKSTEAASPMARPKDNNIPVIIPGRHCLTYTIIETSDLVDPRESDASNNPRGTVFNTSSIARIIIGVMNNATVIIPANKDVLAPK